MNLHDTNLRPALLVVALVTLVGTQIGCQKMAFWRSKPQEMHAGSDVLAVWLRPVDGDSQNVGALILDNDLEGSLDTLTPHRRFRVSVTPEPNGQVTSPSNEPVFTYNVESNK